MTSNQTNKGPSLINLKGYIFTGNNKGANETKSGNTLFSSFPTLGFGNSVNSLNTTDIKGLLFRIIAYLFSILIVILVILLFIHYFITPIFKFKPGAPGIIPVPGWDDGMLFWTSDVTTLNNDKIPISQMYYNYSLNLDVFIQNPIQFSRYSRILFTRGATKKQTPTGDTILGVLDNYNLAIALLPDTSDMVVSVLNTKNEMENVLIPNIPVQEVFRLTVVVMEKAMEVYINGHLIRTRAFLKPLKDVKGNIQGPDGIQRNIVKFRNLKLWSRILSTPEIRESEPKLSTVQEIGGDAMSPSTACPGTTDINGNIINGGRCIKN